MSRLRRLQTTGKIFFVTCKLLRTRVKFTGKELDKLAQVVGQIRSRRHFLLAGYVFMPDHWHALIVPAQGDSIGPIMNAIKVSATRGVNTLRGTRGNLWQARFFDRIMRTLKEFLETLGYMHLNPVRAGLVREAAEWPWSSFRCFGGRGPAETQVDFLNLPAEESAYL